MRPLLCSLLLLTVVLGGCSSATDDPPPASSGAAPGPLTEGLAAMYAGDNPDPEDQREGDCFAERLLADTTTTELQEGGLVDDSQAVVTEISTLDGGLAGKVADAQLARTDFVADSTAAQVSVTKGRLDEQACAVCLTDRLDDAAIRASVVASLEGAWDDPALVRLSEAQRGCVGALVAVVQWETVVLRAFGRPFPTGLPLHPERTDGPSGGDGRHDQRPLERVGPAAARAQQPGGRPRQADDRHQQGRARVGEP